jgi:transcriptional regulator with XRE-family HTH domain
MSYMTYPTLQRVLGVELRKRRLTDGIAQQTLAERARITRQHLRRLEIGEGNPELKTVFALARQLNTTVSELIASAESRVRRE